ncbi:hypothetical protein Vadar_030945 [Vaccinium darrowii]|uniref:Uncharacterized protein n=1 Tax=Vaccinium darrowii TaxID=229202 RepID=A0ACB7XE23_9ERIC|nr:hypothetical protein Vadar_030945 [Vaccinium darrowii]
MPKSCPDKCGNLTIPFPFGIGEHCYLHETFGVECNKSSNSTSLYSTFYWDRKIIEISLDGYATVIIEAFPTCYNKSGDGSLSGYEYSTANPFSVSRSRNKFVAVGCDIYAYIPGDDGLPTSIGCASFCGNLNNSNPTSAGRGYCEVALPRNINQFVVGVGVYSVNTLTRGWTEKPCNTAFVVDKRFSKFDQFNSTISNYADWENIYYDIPIVIDWAIGNISCLEARKSKDYLCSRNAECRDVNAAGGGYNCNCQQGYQGNPYLSDGCQDIDECKDQKNNKCKYNSTCINTPGSFECICPTGYYSSYNAKDPLVVKKGLKEDILAVAKLAKRCLKLNAKKRPSMREVAADLDRLAGKQIQPSHELICREKYLSESESSYSYATGGISEDCSNPSLVFPNHTA